MNNFYFEVTVVCRRRGAIGSFEDKVINIDDEKFQDGNDARIHDTAIDICNDRGLEVNYVSHVTKCGK